MELGDCDDAFVVDVNTHGAGPPLISLPVVFGFVPRRDNRYPAHPLDARSQEAPARYTDIAARRITHTEELHVSAECRTCGDQMEIGRPNWHGRACGGAST